MTSVSSLAAPPRALVLGAVFLTLILWSGTAIANKLAVGHMDAMTAGVLRSLLAGIIAGAIACVVRLPLPANRNQWVLLVVSGVASFAAWPMLLSLGLGATSANRAGLIMAMLPVFTGLIAALFDWRPPSVTWWVGVFIAGVGTVILITHQDTGQVLDSEGTLGGDLLILGGVIICALGYVAGGRLSPILGTWATTFWGLALATAITIPTLILLAPRTDWSAVGTHGWMAIAYLTLMSSIVGYSLWFWALGRGGIARIGSFQFAQPVLTMGFAVPILGERLTWTLVISGIVILAGVAIAQRQPR
ncbi:MAG: DMT family transporter [Alphaproteobacteria bacterium]|nr:DMT family transporter [Alphaproteobacteria bacterium]